MLSTAWAMDFAQYCHVEAPETVLIPHRSGALTAKDKVIPLVLSLYVMGGFVKSIPTQIKMGDNIASLLDWVLKHPPCIDGHGASSDIDQDVQIATYMHIRSCLLRLCLLQTKQLSVADMMLQHQSIVPELLKLAIQQLPAALSAVFGKEFDVISKMENVHALIAWMKDESNEERIKKRAVIETFSTTLFQRLPYINEGDLTPWWVLNAAQHIVVLGGEVEVDEYRIKGLQHFPTVKLNGVSISAGTGIWYYEVVLLSEGLMQIGWIDSAFESDALQGQGVGDHTNSWAYDGFRQKKWNVEAMDYGEKWRSGDVVGVLLDSDRCEMQYFLNGRPLGVAFEDLRLNHPLVPAISLNVDQSAQLHFTANQFLYLPSIDKIQPVSSAILGHVCEHSNPSASSNQQAQENETRRTELIEGLIGLGFPPEWALRCARETSHDLSESGAIAWIMEQMENDNHAVRPVLHGLDYSVRNMQQLDGFTESKPHLLVVSETPLPIHTEEPKPLSTNPFLTEEFCEDAFDEAPFPQQSLPRTSHESEPNRKAASFVLSLADSCRDEEIFPLYIIAESALTILYAQDIANNLVHHASRTKKTCFPETLFLDFIQHVIGMRNDSIERQDYTRVIESICQDNPAFVSVLLNDMLRHFQMACSKEHMYTSFANNTTMTKSIAINMEWSCWLADVLLSISRHCVAANLLIFTPNVWQTLFKAAMSPNATLRHRAIVVTAKFLKEGSPSMESLLPAKIEHFVEWLAVKIRKEKPTRVLYSEYVQSLFYLVVTLDSFFPAKSALLDDNQPSTPDLIVEQINPSSATISIKCSLSEASHFQIAEHGFNSSGYEILEFTNLDEIGINSTQSSHVIPDLRPDTMYRLRLASEGNTYSSGIDIRTPSESILELDPTSMGSNLELLNHNMSVRNRVNKKWHAVRASVAYTSGVHSWDVRIDKCVSKNIFVGICTVDASMENYIGSDAWGWGFLANKAVWHNKSKVQSYGEIFKQGDVINVTLNLDRGTLSFARNGESFGVAVDHLTSNNGDTGYFPAISMYNKDDQVTFAPHEPSSTKSGGAGVATTMQHVRDMELLAQLFEPASISWDSSVYSAWIKWTHSQMNRVISANGEIIEFTTSEVASAPFGLHHGDIVFTPKGMCKVLGIAQYVLWYRLDAHGASASGVGSNTYGFWNVATCRDMLARPHDFPITRRHQHTEPLCSVPTQVSLDEFVEAQKRWTQQLDDQLICHVEQIANLRGYSSVFEISANDILATPSPIASFTQFECLCRLGVIHTANKLFQRLAPLIVSLSSPFISLLHRTRHVLVFPVVEKVIHDLFKKSSTITMPSASVSTTEEDTDEDPIEIPRCKLVLPSTPCAPYWEHNKITTPLASASGNSISLLAQLTAFFERIDPRDLRRHYHNATTSSSLYATTSSPQPRTFRVVCDDLTCDQSTAYMHVLREVAREAQSPRSPLFVPIEGSGSVLVTKLMINPVDFSEEILASYTTVGRVMGIAWRSGIPLPWCLSAVIWKFIAHEDLQLSDWIGKNTLGDTTLSIVQTAMAMASWTESDFEKHSIPFALPSDESPSVAVVRLETYKEYVNAVLAHVLAPFRPALSALVTGLTSIVPRTCFLFLSAAQLQRQLAATLDLLHLQEATTYGDELTSSSPTVLWFWKIVHGLSKDDQRLFCRFVVGQDAWHSSMHVELRSSPSLRLPASVNASAEDALSGYGYPYVERPSESTFVLYLPEYASMDTLQKKLLVAMRHSGSG
ncbi:hypothetical protein LEN26_007158 [Aphanomyces euteiches]|nr:hypothetical protein LEN26_007158 [Aphanomyces euteiches]